MIQNKPDRLQLLASDKMFVNVYFNNAEGIGTFFKFKCKINSKLLLSIYIVFQTENKQCKL